MAYYHGCQAAADGKPRDTNPHQADTAAMLHEHWDRGWTEERARLDKWKADATRSRGLGDGAA